MVKQLKQRKFVGKVRVCRLWNFHGVECLELEDKYGFEGCYMGDLNHPDPRPAHAIWIDKKDAEKLYRLFRCSFDGLGAKHEKT